MLIAFATDFGVGGPYTGQMQLVCATAAPGIPCIDLMCDLPAFDVRHAAHFLGALVKQLPEESVLVGVVDPGVGTQRDAVAFRADGRWLVGPGNGLFDVIVARSNVATGYRIGGATRGLSRSFHGRDLFAPVAADIALGDTSRLEIAPLNALVTASEVTDLAEVIYVDAYGNAVTGIRASAVDPNTTLAVNGKTLPRAATFGDVGKGSAFCYENSLGLFEIAVNQGRAEQQLGLHPGASVVLL